MVKDGILLEVPIQ